jgi:hypothetical protein
VYNDLSNTAEIFIEIGEEGLLVDVGMESFVTLDGYLFSACLVRI